MKKSLFALAAVAVMLSSGAAMAEGLDMSKLSVRAQLNTNDNRTDYVGQGFFAGGVSESKTSGGVFVGYQYTKNLGVEVGYTNLGSVQDMGGDRAKISSYAIPVRAIYTHEVGNGIDLNAKLGVAYFKSKYEEPGFSDTASSTRLTYGLGASYQVAKNVAVTVDYDRYDYKKDGDNQKVDQFGVGVRYSF